MFADDHHMHSLLHIMLIMLASVMMLGIGNSQTTSTIVPNVVQTLPAYMYTDCYDVSAHGTPGNDSHIGTMAKMMDYCGCENPINPIGLVYAGMSIYDENLASGTTDSAQEPARAWICSANANVLCDSETDWYHALSNVSTCPGNAGYFYDASRQLAWGFTTYWDINFCDNVAWVGIYN